MIGDFNDKMLQLARLRLGMTQKDLSDKSKIPQSIISKIEIGFTMPSPLQIKALAKTLNVQESFFYIPAIPYPAITPLFRRNSTISQKEINRAAAIGSITIAQMTQILKASDLVNENLCDIPFLNPDEYDDGAISVARAARRFFNIPNGAVDNITSLMEDHGVMIFYRTDFPDKIAGYTIYPESFSFPYTFVNSSCQGERIRMTLAHELGHIFMHKFETPDCEREAWDFAEEFLMPEDEFVTSLPGKLTNLRDLIPLKLKWRVSIGAISQRLKKLNIITERTFRYLRIQLSQYGKTEPYTIKKEKPQLYTAVLDYCNKKLNYTQSELEYLTGFNSTEFDEYYIQSNPFQRRFSIYGATSKE